MSLTFGAATSDRVDIGTAASITALDPFTVLAWVRPTTLTTARMFYGKGSPVGKIFRLSGTAGNIQTIIARAGGNVSYTTNDTPLANTNVWYLVCLVYDTSKGAGEVVNMYTGKLNSTAVESTYSSTVDASLATLTDATFNGFIGNNNANNQAFQGDIAYFALINRALTLGEVTSWQFKPRVIPGTVEFIALGFNGTGTQPDWSGNVNAGTVTGASQSAHVPLSPILGFGIGWEGAFKGVVAATRSTIKGISTMMGIRTITF